MAFRLLQLQNAKLHIRWVLSVGFIFVRSFLLRTKSSRKPSVFMLISKRKLSGSAQRLLEIILYRRVQDRVERGGGCLPVIDILAVQNPSLLPTEVLNLLATNRKTYDYILHNFPDSLIAKSIRQEEAPFIID
jgi:hypothetical protein